MWQQAMCCRYWQRFWIWMWRIWSKLTIWLHRRPPILWFRETPTAMWFSHPKWTRKSLAWSFQRLKQITMKIIMPDKWKSKLKKLLEELQSLEKKEEANWREATPKQGTVLPKRRQTKQFRSKIWTLELRLKASKFLKWWIWLEKTMVKHISKI